MVNRTRILFILIFYIVLSVISITAIIAYKFFKNRNENVSNAYSTSIQSENKRNNIEPTKKNKTKEDYDVKETDSLLNTSKVNDTHKIREKPDSEQKEIPKKETEAEMSPTSDILEVYDKIDPNKTSKDQEENEKTPPQNRVRTPIKGILKNTKIGQGGTRIKKRVVFNLDKNETR